VKQQAHTSDLLTELTNEASKDTVDLEWLLGHLRKEPSDSCCSSSQSPFSSQAWALLQAWLSLSPPWK
jgi:hypothetical protein